MAKHPRHVKTAPSLFSSTVVPEISCVYAATVPLPFILGTFVRAAQRFINERLAPVWGVEARLRVRPRTRDGAWALVFVDTEDQASADGGTTSRSAACRSPRYSCGCWRGRPARIQRKQSSPRRSVMPSR
jgi:hypothetical protein